MNNEKSWLVSQRHLNFVFMSYPIRWPVGHMYLNLKYITPTWSLYIQVNIYFLHQYCFTRKRKMPKCNTYEAVPPAKNSCEAAVRERKSGMWRRWSFLCWHFQLLTWGIWSVSNCSVLLWTEVLEALVPTLPMPLEILNYHSNIYIYIYGIFFKTGH